MASTGVLSELPDRPRPRALGLVAAAAVAVALIGPSPAGAASTTVANTDSIAIPDSGVVSPYPSTVDVTADPGSIVTDVDVTLSGLSHTFPADVNVLLVGPGGETVFLMSDVGCGTDAVDATITFDQAAAGQLTEPVVSGTFQPTDLADGCFSDTDSMTGPAPAGPYGTTLDVFNGTDPNGTWELYILDDAGVDTGTLAGGWSLTVETAAAPAITSAATASATVGTAFTHTFTATGDPAPSFTFDESDLPPGLSIAGDTLSGTPTAPGTYVIVATAANGVSPDAVQTFTVTVAAQATTTTTPPPPVPPVVAEPTFTG